MTVEYPPLTTILISLVAVILLILILISIAATAGGYFQLSNTEESEESEESIEDQEYMIRENLTPPSNIQMNLGSGKIVSTEGSITNLDVETLNIGKDDNFTFGGKQFKVVTPSAWHVKLQSWSDDGQLFTAAEVNNLIDQGEYFVNYNGKRYSPIALHTSPGFSPGDSWRLIDMKGFQGSQRNVTLQNNAHRSTNKISAGGTFSIDRNNKVDGTGFWTIELKSTNNNGKVVIFT